MYDFSRPDREPHTIVGSVVLFACTFVCRKPFTETARSICFKQITRHGLEFDDVLNCIESEFFFFLYINNSRKLLVLFASNLAMTQSNFPHDTGMNLFRKRATLFGAISNRTPTRPKFATIFRLSGIS